MAEVAEPIDRCRAALRRAGVREEAIKRLPAGPTQARGFLLLAQEMKAQVAIEQLERAVFQARQVASGDSGGLVDLHEISGAGVLQALMELQGLRHGIEFVTGSASDSAVKDVR